MVKTDGSITTTDGVTKTEDVLLTYSEEEKQQNEINASNAKLVFSPKFIPVYPELLKKGFTITEALIYGFIDFYTSNSSSRFYFTNEQISEMLGTSRASITNALSRLEKEGLIKTSRKIKAGGGQIRFISPSTTNPLVHLLKTSSQTTKKPATNNNKINNNKTNDNKNIDTNVSIQKAGYGNPDINEVSLYFLTVMGLPKEDCSQRQSRQYWRLLLNESKTGVAGVKWLIDQLVLDTFYKHNITSSKDLYYNRIKIVARRRGETSGKVAIQT